MVSAAWLKENIDRVKLLDCSWYIPAMNRDGRAEHAASRLPGARYFDVDRVSDPSSPLPHMLPSEAQFAAACDALGIHNDDQVVVYDALDSSAPREDGGCSASSDTAPSRS